MDCGTQVMCPCLRFLEMALQLLRGHRLTIAGASGLRCLLPSTYAVTTQTTLWAIIYLSIYSPSTDHAPSFHLRGQHFVDPLEAFHQFAPLCSTPCTPSITHRSK
jgi:hypothetical protein